MVSECASYLLERMLAYASVRITVRLDQSANRKVFGPFACYIVFLPPTSVLTTGKRGSWRWHPIRWQAVFPHNLVLLLWSREDSPKSEADYRENCSDFICLLTNMAVPFQHPLSLDSSFEREIVRGTIADHKSAISAMPMCRQSSRSRPVKKQNRRLAIALPIQPAETPPDSISPPKG